MADQHQNSQPWDTGLDPNFNYQPNGPSSGAPPPLPPSSSSAAAAAAIAAQTAPPPPPSAVSAGSHSPPDYHHISNGTAAPTPDSLPIPSTGPDQAFADFSGSAPWVDQNQFTPPLGPNDGDPLDGLNLFPDNWNVPTASFPAHSLQFRPRDDGLQRPQDPNSVDLFNALLQGAAVNHSGEPSSRPGPVPVPTAMPSLTPAQQEQLRNIAMPPHLQYQSPKSEPSQLSPQSSNGEGKAVSPDPSKPGSRKRKSSADEDDLDDEDDEDHPVKKTAHNMIEKRYRTNLNDKIAALRDSVPSLRVLSKSARGEDTTEDREELHGLTPAHKLNKATVGSMITGIWMLLATLC